MDVESTLIQTFKNKIFDYNNIESNELDIEVIAHALANTCRFGGHCERFFSVCEHSLNVYTSVLVFENRSDLALEALMHDASEAFIVDLPRPLKRKFPTYKLLETEIETYIARKFNLKYDGKWDDVIKRADERMLITERNSLFKPPYIEGLWPDVEPYNYSLFSVRNPATLFVETFNMLMGERHGKV